METHRAAVDRRPRPRAPLPSRRVPAPSPPRARGRATCGAARPHHHLEGPAGPTAQARPAPLARPPGTRSPLLQRAETGCGAPARFTRARLRVVPRTYPPQPLPPLADVTPPPPLPRCGDVTSANRMAERRPGWVPRASGGGDAGPGLPAPRGQRGAGRGGARGRLRGAPRRAPPAVANRLRPRRDCWVAFAAARALSVAAVGRAFGSRPGRRPGPGEQPPPERPSRLRGPPWRS